MEDWFYEKVNMHVNNTLMAKHTALYLRPYEDAVCTFLRSLECFFICLSLLICAASSIEPGINKTKFNLVLV